LEALWSDLTCADAKGAYRAIWTLASAPAQSVPFLGRHLKPVVAGDGKRIARLIADLDSKDFATRKRATRELRRQGAAAEVGLRRALRGKLSLEVRQRVGQLLKRLQGPRRLRAIRVLEVLEHSAGADGRRMLKRLAGGAKGAWLTAEAKAVLQRLEDRDRAKPAW
jgi:hypothetical protein